MSKRIRVYGNLQQCRAMGIISAYLRLYPFTTLSDLKNAFPVSLNSAYESTRSLFYEKSEFNQLLSNQTENSEGNQHITSTDYFTADDEVIRLNDGSIIIFAKIWKEDALQQLTRLADMYGIEVSHKFPLEGFNLRGFHLELLKNSAPEESRTIRHMRTAVVALSITAFLLVMVLISRM